MITFVGGGIKTANLTICLLFTLLNYNICNIIDVIITIIIIIYISYIHMIFLFSVEPVLITSLVD